MTGSRYYVSDRNLQICYSVRKVVYNIFLVTVSSQCAYIFLTEQFIKKLGNIRFQLLISFTNTHPCTTTSLEMVPNSSLKGLPVDHL